MLPSHADSNVAKKLYVNGKQIEAWHFLSQTNEGFVNEYRALSDERLVEMEAKDAQEQLGHTLLCHHFWDFKQEDTLLGGKFLTTWKSHARKNL